MTSLTDQGPQYYHHHPQLRKWKTLTCRLEALELVERFVKLTRKMGLVTLNLSQARIIRQPSHVALPVAHPFCFYEGVSRSFEIPKCMAIDGIPEVVLGDFSVGKQHL